MKAQGVATQHVRGLCSAADVVYKQSNDISSKQIK